jgi:hypothetical protein
MHVGRRIRHCLQGTANPEISDRRRNARLGDFPQDRSKSPAALLSLNPGGSSPRSVAGRMRGVSAFWGDSENNRRTKFYRLTKPGRKQFAWETKRWDRISLAIAQAFEAL